MSTSLNNFVDISKPGYCGLCGEPCPLGEYLHFECAQLFDQEKRKIREIERDKKIQNRRLIKKLKLENENKVF